MHPIDVAATASASRPHVGPFGRWRGRSRLELIIDLMAHLSLRPADARAIEIDAELVDGYLLAVPNDSLEPSGSSAETQSRTRAALVRVLDVLPGTISRRRSRSPSPSSPRTTTSCSTGAARCSTASAPVIKLPADATEDDHLALLGLLNSSTACFWMKQVFHDKGQQGGSGVASRRSVGDVLRAFDGTKLGAFPVLDSRAEALALARELDALARSYRRPEPCRAGQAARCRPAERLEANRARDRAAPGPDDRACRRNSTGSATGSTA